jgi:hypothetical protein
MAIALMMHKDEHTPDELRQLAEAPYFSANLVRVSLDLQDSKPKRRESSPSPHLKDVADRDFLPSGTPLRSHGIAPSTRTKFEMIVKAELPIVDRDQLDKFMNARQLGLLLRKHPELQSDQSVSELYALLKVVSKLGFCVGWYEDLQENRPKGWR